MEIISDILYWISTGLLVPVIVALILLFLRSLLLISFMVFLFSSICFSLSFYHSSLPL